MNQISRTPQHVLALWWSHLLRRHRAPQAQAKLRHLTWASDVFRDYAWVDDMLDGFSLASKVYYVIDAPEKDVAVMRFVPEVAQFSRTFAPMRLARAVYVTLVRTADETWRVWGLGDSIPTTRRVKGA